MLEENTHCHCLDFRKCLASVNGVDDYLCICVTFPLITQLLINVFEYSFNKHLTSV